ncbi:hypothetical protein DPMN_092740 [Dreissena polymorpha]|uniref:Uncharacterized protein n=1 Tax=Dreissena polymorpha TaxID=45954 RepID=A0A9D4L4I6_DREPO|nr:hypothetical protein DPMN_092740 [Dreissena polymorpha]
MFIERGRRDVHVENQSTPSQDMRPEEERDQSKTPRRAYPSGNEQIQETGVKTPVSTRLSKSLIKQTTRSRKWKQIHEAPQGRRYHCAATNVRPVGRRGLHPGSINCDRCCYVCAITIKYSDTDTFNMCGFVLERYTAVNIHF